MNGLMKKYRESLAQTPEPILLSQCPKIKLDLRGLMQYAKDKGVKVADLTEKEKVRFIKQ
ncbi:MAG: hypothetical protein HFG64_11075 [Lachnospiraceae bacterium]|mgnify:CR=1 FL=1|nr:hypothetical protein [Lachnospiraceae bacterium]